MPDLFHHPNIVAIDSSMAARLADDLEMILPLLPAGIYPERLARLRGLVLELLRIANQKLGDGDA